MNSRHPFIVVDQNVMRDAGNVLELFVRCQKDNLRLLIPDGAFFELSKSSVPLDTWRRSLIPFARTPSLVCVSQKITKVVAQEVRVGRVCPDIVDPAGTAFLQTMLHELNKGDSPTLQSFICDRLPQLLPDSLEVWNDKESFKQLLVNLRDMLKRELSEAQIKAMRQAPNAAVGKWLADTQGIRFVFQGIQSRGVDDRSALSLTVEPSLSASWLAAQAGIALHWIAFGGLEDCNASDATNDWHDTEYVALGAICQGFQTHDKRAASLCEAVSRALDHRRDWLTQQLRPSDEPM